MKNNNSPLFGEDILHLLKERGNVCVTIVLPTHKVSADRKIDKFQVEKALDYAQQALKVNYAEKEFTPILKKLELLASTIDYNHNLDGLGLYVSPNVELMVHFPFNVEEKIVVANNFEVRDVLYLTQLSKPYLALLASEKQVRLFTGNGTPPKEIIGDDFPMEYTETYLYNTPSRGSSNQGNPQMRSFEHDKSTMQAVRFKDFFRAADHHLSKYMILDTPLIIAGPEKVLSWYESVSEFHNHIIGRIQGNFDHAPLADLGTMFTDVVKEEISQHVRSLMNEYRERVGEGRGVAGIQEIWSVACEGRGWKLLVEKDYRLPGFTEEGKAHFLRLKPDLAPHHTMADAVDEVIEEILNKGGEVYFAENGQLAEFGGMILITRY